MQIMKYYKRNIWVHNANVIEKIRKSRINRDLLIDYNIDPNIRNNDGDTAIMIIIDAADQGEEEVDDMFLELFSKYRNNDIINWNVQNKKGNSLLHLAIICGVSCNTIIPMLFNDVQNAVEKINPNLQNNDGNTPLLLVANDDYSVIIRFETVEMLVDFGGDVNIKNNDGHNALFRYLAVSQNEVFDFQVLDLFIRETNPADLNSQFDDISLINKEGRDSITQNGVTALMLLADMEFDREENKLEKYVDILHLMLKLGANPLLKDSDGKIAYDYCDNKFCRSVLRPNNLNNSSRALSKVVTDDELPRIPPVLWKNIMLRNRLDTICKITDVEMFKLEIKKLGILMGFPEKLLNKIYNKPYFTQKSKDIVCNLFYDIIKLGGDYTTERHLQIMEDRKRQNKQYLLNEMKKNYDQLGIDDESVNFERMQDRIQGNTAFMERVQERTRENQRYKRQREEREARNEPNQSEEPLFKRPATDSQDNDDFGNIPMQTGLGRRRQLRKCPHCGNFIRHNNLFF
jgi:ankyrin repeat protein